MTTNFFINQSIVIHQVKIGGISNSSVFQIGSAGVIKSLSTLQNTGGFEEVGPESTAEILAGQTEGTQPNPAEAAGPFVPLKGPTG
ncbi:spore germination protein GerPB [Sutcliffiella rhizosphaerae]|uniref:Spore germination protein GerPB n=1 Tax=Sutcliffiella rhizosphaerae TaxID=2880967 RepID=A0ABM8YU14_9BACI|nr:spore germination protein GerPB [Sutcliffiella rhizosphaerae]CAG9623462.1 putative spore germination protein GerPB [Sutcliffiella rhizosphaerae]